ncbi:MAG: chromosome partitioning protein ParA [Pseudomonas sp. CO183]|nr:MAG: chromosome partitioning protein ParA [Pseudomonas sp. CO183]
MPEHDLQSQLEELRNQLAQDTPLTDEERASLHAIAQDIESRLATQGTGEANDSLVDGVNLAVERFEVRHPNMAMTLRNIMQTLANMGI